MEELALTKRQMETLELLRDYRRRSGYSPTIREVAEKLGLSSVSTVAEHLDSLEAMGIIRRQRDRARSVLLTARGRSLLAVRDKARAARESAGGVVAIPLLGAIAAGEPIEALDPSDELEVPAALAGRRCYALRVRGRSMIEEGIFDGDYVVVEEKQVPENGETVVALIDGREATLKKFYRERANGGWRIRLQPANPDMDPIILGPDDQVEIQGRVRGVLRVL
jgi:repressor LexA